MTRALAPHTLEVFHRCNQQRHDIATAAKVLEARRGIRILANIDGHPITKREPALFRMYFRTLVTRVEYGDLSLAEIAAKLGVTKHVYASRLRRALRYANTIETRANKAVIGR